MLKIIMLFSMLLFSISGSASAEVYKGIISEVYSGGQSLKIAQVDDLTSEERTVVVNTDEQTALAGVASVADLKTGMTVSVNADEAGSNLIRARSIEII